MIFWEQIAADLTRPRVIKVAVLLIAAALVLYSAFWFNQKCWTGHQALKQSILRHQPLSECVAATPEVARRLWGLRYSKGWYTAIGEGQVSVLLYTLL